MGGRGTLAVIKTELYIVLQVDGVCPDRACAIGLKLGHDTLLYGAGEHETTVVVGVLTDKVDATGGSIYGTCRAVEVLDKTTSYIFCL